MYRKIVSADLETPILIVSNTYANYFYIPVNIEVRVAEYTATLQTGRSYDHNDYNCPSNNLEVYDDRSDLILFKLWMSYESDLDDEFVTDLNQECGTRYNYTEIAELREGLGDVIIDAQLLITEAEAVAVAELDNDTHIYVMYNEREEDSETGEKRVCAQPKLFIFDDENDAQHTLDAINQTIDAARVITKQTARSSFPDNF